MASKIQANISGHRSSTVWLLLLTASSVTLYFNPRIQDPFATPKLIIVLLMSAWLIGHLIYGYKKAPLQLKSQEFITLLILGLFLLSMIVAFYFSENKITALIGETQRRTGLLTYVALGIIFLFASRSINYYYSIRLIKVATVTGFTLSCYGIIQMTGNDPIAWNNPYNAIITTLGNPNFAAAALAIFALISMFSLVVEGVSRSYKIFSVITVVMSFVAIYNSQSRQGLMTFLVGFIFYLSVYLYFKFSRIKIVVVVVSLLISLFLVFGMLQKGPLSPFLYKESVSIRGYYWRAAFEMFNDHLFFGVGLDSYAGFFKEYREIEYALKYGYEITNSNAHNVILQLFSTGGLFVGSLYLILIFYIIFIGLKLVKNTSNDTQKVILLLLAAWIAFQSQAFISIDNLGISIWGWLIGGALLGLSQHYDSGTLIGDRSFRVNRQNKVNLFQPFISSVFLVPSIMVSIYLYQADSDTYSVRSLANLSQSGDIMKKYIVELESNPLVDPFYKFESYQILARSGFAPEASDKIRILLSTDPKNLNYLEWLALYEQDLGNYNFAITHRTQIVQFDPWNAQNYLYLGVLYKQIGDSENRVKMLNKILSFAENTDISKLARTELA